ncbi:MAG: dissimilatory sulfite reductase D family protein [Syntrophobacterales bacterium]|jgi:DeoR/GlpR family transcriptional regulator of sugar metabolism
MSEEEKQAIIDFMKKKKGKTKHYFNELCKAVPHLKMRVAKKVINEMVNDGQLKYWSSGSTTLYLLPEHADVGKEEDDMN